VRFAKHSPTRSVAGAFDRDEAYCFATEGDANHVVEQLRNYGWRARVITESRKPPPQAPVAPTVPEPPEHLRSWVDGLIAEGTGIDQIEAVYRAVAPLHHPDAGGSTTDMQHLNAAIEWLRKQRREDDDVPF
jgi:hypothetical protein